jgi:hypothetical protein
MKKRSMLWVFVLVFGITGVNVGAQMGTETPQEPRVKKQSKIPDAIHKAVGTYDASKPINKSRGPLASGGDVQVDATGNILIELHAAGAVGANQLADVEALGATIVMSTADMSVPPGLGVIVAWSPPDQLEAVEALDWVVTVRPVENNPPDVGPNESEGVFLHDADMAQARGIDGTGVTVGVISDGVESLSVAQAAGDLPICIKVTPKDF